MPYIFIDPVGNSAGLSLANIFGLAFILLGAVFVSVSSISGEIFTRISAIVIVVIMSVAGLSFVIDGIQKNFEHHAWQDKTAVSLQSWVKDSYNISLTKSQAYDLEFEDSSDRHLISSFYKGERVSLNLIKTGELTEDGDPTRAEWILNYKIIDK